MVSLEEKFKHPIGILGDGAHLLALVENGLFPASDPASAGFGFKSVRGDGFCFIPGIGEVFVFFTKLICAGSGL